jgi:hypothetical protein
MTQFTDGWGSALAEAQESHRLHAPIPICESQRSLCNLLEAENVEVVVEWAVDP